MAFTEQQKKIRQLQRQWEKVDAAEGALANKVKEVFPVGALVWWYHGGHQRHATVLEHYRLRVFVKSATGKQYWQDMRWIIHCMARAL